MSAYFWPREPNGEHDPVGSGGGASPRFVRLRGKSVQISEPYRPTVRGGDELVGRDHELRMVIAAWAGQSGLPPLAPLLVGEAGVGKNRLIYELARCSAKELYVLQGHEDVTADDLMCSVRFSDDSQRKMDYLLSPLATAMVRGGICFIDEIGKLRHRALAPLASVLDDRRYLDSTLLGERIHAKPGFRFVAATNTVDLAGELLPGFIRSRLRPRIDVGFPPRAEITAIVKRRLPRLAQLSGDGDRLLRRFWQLWRAARKEAPPSPRDTLYVFALAFSLADTEAEAPERLLAGQAGDGAARPTISHLEAAFTQLFAAEE